MDPLDAFNIVLRLWRTRRGRTTNSRSNFANTRSASQRGSEHEEEGTAQPVERRSKTWYAPAAQQTCLV